MRIVTHFASVSFTFLSPSHTETKRSNQTVGRRTATGSYAKSRPRGAAAHRSTLLGKRAHVKGNLFIKGNH